MRKSARSRAEEQFTATQKKSDQALKEKEKAWRDVSEKMARLKALRLAKEAEQKAEAEQTAPED